MNLMNWAEDMDSREIVLDIMRKNCGLAIDLDDAKEMIGRQFDFLRAGEINCGDRPTTHRAFLELYSTQKRCSVEEARMRLSPERLEEWRRKWPWWSSQGDLDLFCDQRNSKEFISDIRIVGYTKIRVLFVDGTEDSLDVRNLPIPWRLHLSPSEVTQLSKITEEKLRGWFPSWQPDVIRQAIARLDEESLLVFVERPNDIKREINNLPIARARSLSSRDVVEAICEAVDNLLSIH